jgi:hypothetical protein
MPSVLPFTCQEGQQDGGYEAVSACDVGHIIVEANRKLVACARSLDVSKVQYARSLRYEKSPGKAYNLLSLLGSRMSL